MITPTGREERYQRPVPEQLRLVVPARYGIEIVQKELDIDPSLIISDQLNDRFVQSMWDERYLLFSPDELKERIVDPLISFLSSKPAKQRYA